MKVKEISISKHILKYGLAYGGIILIKLSIVALIFKETTPENNLIILIDLLLLIGAITFCNYFDNCSNTL